MSKWTGLWFESHSSFCSSISHIFLFLLMKSFLVPLNGWSTWNTACPPKTLSPWLQIPTLKSRIILTYFTLSFLMPCSPIWISHMEVWPFLKKCFISFCYDIIRCYLIREYVLFIQEIWISKYIFSMLIADNVRKRSLWFISLVKEMFRIIWYNSQHLRKHIFS